MPLRSGWEAFRILEVATEKNPLPFVEGLPPKQSLLLHGAAAELAEPPPEAPAVLAAAALVCWYAGGAEPRLKLDGLSTVKALLGPPSLRSLPAPLLLLGWLSCSRCGDSVFLICPVEDPTVWTRCARK